MKEQKILVNGVPSRYYIRFFKYETDKGDYDRDRYGLHIIKNNHIEYVEVFNSHEQAYKFIPMLKKKVKLMLELEMTMEIHNRAINKVRDLHNKIRKIDEQIEATKIFN